MKKFILLVLVGIVVGDDHDLGDRIVATEHECNRLFKLNENWNTNKFNEKAVQYVDLYFLCEDSLAEDKYAYIDQNHVDMSQYPGKDDKFPVMTTNGEELVDKPPERSQQDVDSMKHKLTDYLKEVSGKLNPLHKLASIQSELGQEIVDKQVKCELLALLLLKHPEDKDIEEQHTQCMDKLNCIKERFMDQHEFTRKHYPDYFPILYKGRGTMMNAPPKSDKPLCSQPIQPNEHKRELEKWIEGLERAGETLSGFGEAGTALIKKLKSNGMTGADKVLSIDELNDMMANAKSVTFVDDDDEETDDDSKESGVKTYQVYGDDMFRKLADLESKGVKIAHSRLERLRPRLESVKNLAASTSRNLKKLESQNIKPAMTNVAKELSDVESLIQVKSKDAMGEVKHDFALADNVAKETAAKLKVKSSSLLDKLASKDRGHQDNVVSDDGNIDQEEKTKSGWLSSFIEKLVQADYLPQGYDNMQKPALSNLLKEMGGREEDGKDKLSDDELAQMLESIKKDVKKRAKDLNLQENEIRQAAAVVKGIMHTVLGAATHGHGIAKDMKPDEIDTAKSLVDQLVDYATAELVNIDTEEKEVVHVVKKDNADLLSGQSPTVVLNEPISANAEKIKDNIDIKDRNSDEENHSDDSSTKLKESI